MKAILILMDSLNRHMMQRYNPDAWMKTPNIDTFAGESIQFDGHWVGSAPCMPARRDIFTGRLNFLERGWGPIEPYDVTFPRLMQEKGVFTHIITDHHHYFEIGGEHYCQQFDTWDFIRGQEHDRYVSRVNGPALPDQYLGIMTTQYELNRQRFESDREYPTPVTFQHACDWVRDNRGADDFFLHVEVFDPHEPFDCPQEFLDLYEDDWQGPHYDWSSYSKVGSPRNPEHGIEHLRKAYAATATMTDKWFGTFIDTLKENGMYDDTMIILTSDHGHLLGEHGWTAKNDMHVYNEIGHIPLFIHMPQGQGAGTHIDALTQNIDLMPTLCDCFDLETPDRVKGKSLLPLIDGETDKLRDACIYGWFSKAVNVTDGTYTYLRVPQRADNSPCYSYCSTLDTLNKFIGVPNVVRGKRGGTSSADRFEVGPFLEHTSYPVFKVPFENAEVFAASITPLLDEGTLLFDIENDYAQQKALRDPEVEAQMIQKLKDCMIEADSPVEQFERLGI